VDPYARSVAARPLVVATYAAVIATVARHTVAGDPDLRLSVVASGQQPVITLRVEGTDQSRVVRAVHRAADEGGQFVAATRSLRDLAVTRPGVVTMSTASRWNLPHHLP